MKKKKQLNSTQAIVVNTKIHNNIVFYGYVYFMLIYISINSVNLYSFDRRARICQQCHWIFIDCSRWHGAVAIKRIRHQNAFFSSFLFCRCRHRKVIYLKLHIFLATHFIFSVYFQFIYWRWLLLTQRTKSIYAEWNDKWKHKKIRKNNNNTISKEIAFRSARHFC